MPKPPTFCLRAAAAFYAAFTPGSGMAAADDDGARLTLAFRLDASFDPVAAALREDGDAIVVEFAGTDDVSTLRAQLERMLGLGDDSVGWASLGAREPLVGMLRREFAGFHTAAKASPYDAATWAVIAPRFTMPQAARLKTAISRALGDRVTLAGRTYDVFPSPEVLAALTRFEGLPDEKVARLRGVGRAALEGRLDANRLRAVGEAEALASLQTLRGVGPWAASHIYYRGAAPPDGLPLNEPRVLHGYAHAAVRDRPSEAEFRRAAEAWRPYRMWVCVLLARHLARTDGWRQPGLAGERARAGRALARRTSSRAGVNAVVRPGAA